MTAARYWRWIGLETYAQVGLELSEVQLWSSTARIDGAAAITCTHTPVAGSLSALQDGSAGGSVEWSEPQVSNGGFALMWDMGSTVEVTRVKVGGGAARSKFIAMATLQYFDAGSWITEVTWGRFPWPGANQLGDVMGGGDLYFALVTALLHFESDFTDVKGHVFVPSGSPAIDATSPIVGIGSYYAATSGRYLTADASADWDMGSFDWCVEGRASTPTPANLMILMTGRTYTGSDRGPTVFITGGQLRGFFGDSSGAVLGDCLGGTIVANTPFDWAYTRAGSTLRLFLNGFLVASATSSVACGGGTPLTIGRDPGTGGREWVGRIDEVRRTRGVARYTAAYTPSSGPFPDGTFDALRSRSVDVITLTAASSAVPEHSTSKSICSVARDVEFGGPGTIYGTTKTKGTSNQPAKARVVLQHQRSKLPVRETWSDPVTGAFVFSGIDTSQQFLALAEDAEGHFRPVAANRLTPEVV